MQDAVYLIFHEIEECGKFVHISINFRNDQRISYPMVHIGLYLAAEDVQI